jgi:hypothetical protein
VKCLRNNAEVKIKENFVKNSANPLRSHVPQKYFYLYLVNDIKAGGLSAQFNSFWATSSR